MELITENNNGYVPLYRQIKRLITDALVTGEWAPGQPIPSEIELAQRFKVSQGTVRKAISELASQKLVVRHQGKGTFCRLSFERTHQISIFKIISRHWAFSRR
jgi:GntR family transcriptional regulator